MISNRALRVAGCQVRTQASRREARRPFIRCTCVCACSVGGVSCELYTRSTLADGGAGRALLVLESDLLERHKLLGEPTPAFEHRRVRALRAPGEHTGVH